MSQRQTKAENDKKDSGLPPSSGSLRTVEQVAAMSDMILDLTESSSAFMAPAQERRDSSRETTNKRSPTKVSEEERVEPVAATRRPAPSQQLLHAVSSKGGDTAPTLLARQEAGGLGPGAYAAAPRSHLESRQAVSREELSQRLSQQSDDDDDLAFVSDEEEEQQQQSQNQQLEVVEAFKVDESEENDSKLEKSMRQRIMDEAVPADAVVNNSAKKKRRRSKIILLVVSVALIVAIIVGFLVREKSDDGQITKPPEKEPTMSPSSNVLPPRGTFTTLGDVLDRGVLRCGGFVGQEESQTSIRFNYEPCRAIAAAIFDGDGDRYEAVTFSTSGYGGLEKGEYDVFAHVTSITMDRDIYGDDPTGPGIDFSYPFFFAGSGFLGQPDFVECAEKFDPFNGICRDLRVCTAKGSSAETFMEESLLDSVTVKFDGIQDGIALMNSGECNAAVTEPITVDLPALQAAGLSSDLNLTIGTNTFSNEPGCIATVDASTEMSDMVDSVIKILFTAEAMNITRENVAEYEFDPSLDEPLKSRVVNVVSAVGNYADVFEKGDTAGRGRDAINRLNRLEDDSGLMYVYPFGDLDEFPTITSDTMEDIRARGHLRCGIVEQPVFAEYDPNSDEYSGFFVEYCRALAAALFVGDTTKVEFALLNEENAYVALSAGAVDILSGQRASLTNEFFEPTTGLSYSFTSPVFYGDDGSIWVLVSHKIDALWSSFVFWCCMALVFAEQDGISYSNALDMPAVNLFGTPYIQSFRDCVSQVGNHGDIYNRTLESTIPRSGRNKLNVAPFGPQQIAYPLQ